MYNIINMAIIYVCVYRYLMRLKGSVRTKSHPEDQLWSGLISRSALHFVLAIYMVTQKFTAKLEMTKMIVQLLSSIASGKD